MLRENIEYRSSEWKSREGEEMIVEGYATTFNQLYTLYEDPKTGYKYQEVIDSRAFENCDMTDVILQYDHEGRVFARTRNGTLKVTPDGYGLKVVADLSTTEGSRSIYEDIRSGLICKMSFGFAVAGEEYDAANRIRTITKISKLYDVSVVSIPANEHTEVHSMRSYRALSTSIEQDRESFLCAEYRGKIKVSLKGRESYPEEYDPQYKWMQRKPSQDIVSELEDVLSRYDEVTGEFHSKRKVFYPWSGYVDASFDRELRDLDLGERANYIADVVTYENRSAKELEPLVQEAALIAKAFRLLREDEERARAAVEAGFGKVIDVFESSAYRDYKDALGAGKDLSFMNNTATGYQAEMRTLINGAMETRAAGTSATMSTMIPTNTIDQYVIENEPGAFLAAASVTNIAHEGNLFLPISTLKAISKHPENEEIATEGFVPDRLMIEHDEYAYNTGYSAKGKRLSISSLENIVSETLLRSMMMKMDGICLDAVIGLEYTDDTNAVKVTAAPTFDDLTKLAGMLGADFVSGAKWYVSSATYFNWLLSLKDANGELVLDPGKSVAQQAPLGFHIRIDSQVPDNTVYFGNGKRVHLNYAAGVELNFWTDYDHNTEKAGVRCVAGAAAEPGSFVKLYKA